MALTYLKQVEHDTTNHSLPHAGSGAYSGGINVSTYLKVLTHQETTAEGTARVGPWAAHLAAGRDTRSPGLR